MDLSDLELERLRKVERLRERGIEPYPPRVQRTHTTAEAVAAFEAAEPNQAVVQATVTGRMALFRAMGKASFAHLEDGAGRLQLFFKQDVVGEDAYQMLLKDIDLGDFLEATGALFRTKTGEVTLQVESFRLIAKAITPPPEKWHGLKDVETRLRQRYADLLANPEVREVFRTRAKVIAAARRFLDARGFLEVETPILQPIYGGAAARPFTTHHNQLHQDLYLRISFELYLKRLLVGMYDRVYEIGRDFRNEGVSFKHNPEFTQLEFYAAYLDYNDVMRLTEELIAYVALEVRGTTRIRSGGHDIELAPPWKRMTLREAIVEYADIDYVQYPTADSLRTAIRAQGGNAPGDAAWGKLVDGLLGDHVEPKLIQPTFVYDYPRDISPLAKRKPGDDTHVERFEFFIGGVELGNAFTELNDPIDQEQRFLDMQQLYGAEDEEAHPMDEDYLRAMRYGMPPNGGFGMGIDRLTMLFTDKDTIREVVLFPHLRSREA
ncbi:MAG TPA: lysine--tRNA ligase [Anaerolineae bacterium]|nr:lysine--tRNA ligase [Anaerolineae bacterium]